MIELIPAIDIIDGKCVRLTQGDYATKKVYNEDRSTNFLTAIDIIHSIKVFVESLKTSSGWRTSVPLLLFLG